MTLKYVYCLQNERSCDAMAIQNLIGIYARPRLVWYKNDVDVRIRSDISENYIQ